MRCDEQLTRMLDTWGINRNTDMFLNNTPQTTDEEDTPSRRTIILGPKGSNKNMQPATEKIHTTKESICNLPLNKYILQKNQDRFTMISDGKREMISRAMTIIFRVDKIIFRVVKIIIRIFREPFISFRLEIAESHYVRATQKMAPSSGYL